MIAYELKLLPEAIWAAAVAAVTVAAQILSTTDFHAVTDWQTWAIAGAAAVGRAVLGAAIQTFAGKGPVQQAEPTPIKSVTGSS